MEMIFSGRTVVKGKASGIAMVTDKPVCYVGGIDTDTGEFTEHDHPWFKQSVKGKILVYPTGKGSTGGSYVIYEAACNGVGPAAIINNRIEQVTAVGVILGEIPTIDQVQPDPIAFIKDGDFLEVDATNGIVRVIRDDHHPT
ncbi:MAG: aconitase X swivel domain-containing protein [Acetivibrionales bacterium]|jgi:predicted aconitase with swiveling domain